MESKSLKDKKFDSIYQAYKNSIFKVAMHYTKDQDLAEEITQRAFFQLYVHFDSVKLETVQSWLVITARNLVFNYNRDKQREVPGEMLDTLMEEKSRACYMNNMDEYYLRKSQKELARQLELKILERLYKEHERWYNAIILVYCLGKTQQEAAEELGITVEVLNSRVYRARQWIRKNYEKEYEEVVNWF